MIDKDNLVRQKFLLGLSLSEISFIYFIIILLVSLNYISDYKKKNKELKTDKQEIREKLDNLTISLVESQKYITKLEGQLGISKKERERSFADRQMDIRKIKEDMDILKKDKLEYDKIIKKKEKLKLDNKSTIVILEEFSEIKKQLEEFGTDNDSVDDKISDLVANASKYDSQKEELEKLGKDLELAKKETTDKKGEGDGHGHGPPPCFFTVSQESNRLDKKKEDYMYKIYVHKNKFVMEPNWKAKDKEQMEEIWSLIKVDKVLYSKSRASSRKKFTLSIQEFDKFGKIIKDHGEAKTKKCNHYAVVERSFKVKKDGVPDGMAYMAWDDNFKIIDEYFYSYCPPCLRK